MAGRNTEGRVAWCDGGSWVWASALNASPDLLDGHERVTRIVKTSLYLGLGTQQHAGEGQSLGPQGADHLFQEALV